MKYIKKPVVVEAIKWNRSNVDEIRDFAGDSVHVDYDYHNLALNMNVSRKLLGIPPLLTIHTLEGDMTTSVGDMIIKGVNGEFYPCKTDIFDKTYELYTE